MLNFSQDVPYLPDDVKFNNYLFPASVHSCVSAALYYRPLIFKQRTPTHKIELKRGICERGDLFKMPDLRSFYYGSIRLPPYMQDVYVNMHANYVNMQLKLYYIAF